jgi:hypothetical protein
LHAEAVQEVIWPSSILECNGIARQEKDFASLKIQGPDKKMEVRCSA